LLSVGEEGEAVQRYLEVMQARLGERLRFRVEISDAAAAFQLPPGLPQALEFNATTQAQVTGAEAGHGLRNSSLRLAQAFGARARLRLAPSEPAGCMAQVLVRPEAAAAPAAAIH
jgi:sensor histidine kinase YesM